MKRKNRTGSHLFFIEFIIVLFFFLIVSTVCLQLFTRAHVITKRADTLSHAQAAAASVAAGVEEVLSDSPNVSSEKTGGTVTPTDNADSQDEAGGANGLLLSAAEYLPGASLSALPDDPFGQEGLVIFYDKEFQTCTADDARYLLSATFDPTETLQISVTDYDHAPVYEFSVALHRPMTREEALQ